MKRFNFLVNFALLLFIVNVLFTNDYVLLWDGAEAHNVAQRIAGTINFSNFFIFPADIIARGQEFWWRLPAALALIGSMIAFYFLAFRLFGKQNAQYAVLALSSSLFLPFVGKTATADAFAYLTQMISWLLLLQYLKKPSKVRQYVAYVVFTLAYIFEPFGTFAFLLINGLILYALHPNKKHLRSLYHVPIALGVAVILRLSGDGTPFWDGGEGYWSITSGNVSFYFYLLSFLGWLPFLGFIVGGVREMISKIKKREELSIILLAGLGGALLSHSIVFHTVMAILVGRQMHIYFNEKYPYRSFVKTGALLQLVGAFILATFLIMRLFFEFKGVGFRASLAVTTAYWMPAFVCVLGLYGMNERYVWFGASMSGIFSLLIFQLQITPLIESRREASVVLIETEGPQIQKDALLLDNFPRKPKEKVYGLIQFESVLQDTVSSDAAALEKIEIDPLLLPKDSILNAGWDDDLRAVKYELK